MSNNKTISKQTGAIAMVGLVLAAALVAAVVSSPSAAFAQESERREKFEKRLDVVNDSRPHRPGIHVATGAGIATDTDTGENLRSGFRVIVQKLNGTENEFAVKRGVIGILVEGERVLYTMDPDSWQVFLSEDGHTFEASGQVQQEEGTFDVTLNGYFAMHTRIGNLWSIEGTMQGEDKEYKLHYVGISHPIRLGALDELR